MCRGVRPPANKYAIKRIKTVREEDLVLPGSKSPCYSLFPASLSHDRMIGYKKLIAFAGIDPTVYQSGKFEGASRISKRGNRHLRRVIWLMTTCVIQHNDTFRAYFMKKRSEGQPFKKAVFATAHRLIRVTFAMLTQRTMFREVCA